jgi:hypothetical protein
LLTGTKVLAYWYKGTTPDTSGEQEEIRALQNRNTELYEEREEAVELLDTSVSKAASLHRRLESLQQTHSAHTAASERRESEKDKACVCVYIYI